jgi:hypothetical protein
MAMQSTGKRANLHPWFCAREHWNLSTDLFNTVTMFVVNLKTLLLFVPDSLVGTPNPYCHQQLCSLAQTKPPASLLPSRLGLVTAIGEQEEARDPAPGNVVRCESCTIAFREVAAFNAKGGPGDISSGRSSRRAGGGSQDGELKKHAQRRRIGGEHK